MPDLRRIDCEPPGKGVTELLADLRARHQKGEISGLAVVVMFRDGTVSSGFSDLRSSATMIGGVELLRSRLVRQLEGFDD